MRDQHPFGAIIRTTRPIARLVPALLTCLALAAGRAGAQGAPPPPAPVRPGAAAPEDSLYRTVAALDSAMFDAYNRCDLDALGAFASEDLEFYHDRGGLARGRQSLVDGVRRNVCGKTRRDLVPGTLEVYPIAGYGAMETGEHLFCDPNRYRRCADATSGIARFVMLWRYESGRWQMTRVFSYGHLSSHERPGKK
jgi:hypothetical protein